MKTLIKEIKAPLIFTAVLTFILMLTGHLIFLTDFALFSYMHLFLLKAFDWLLPLTAAFCALFYPAIERKARICAFFTLPLFFCAIALIYHLPYRYEEMIISYSYSSGDALIIALLYCILAFLKHYVHALCLGAITVLLSRIVCRRPYGEIFYKSERVSPFDLAMPRAMAALISSIAAFVLALIPEIYETVTFFAESFDTISFAEGVTVAASYLFLILLLALSHPLLLVFSTKKENEV